MHYYQVNQFRVPLEKKDNLKTYALKKLGIKFSLVKNFEIVRMSLDARKGFPVRWTCTLRIELKSPLKRKEFQEISPKIPQDVYNYQGEQHFAMPSQEVHVVGAGPAGLWAALGFARRGYKVHLYERGKAVQERFKDIRHFIKQGRLDVESNVLFGEGGAGAFSDGKLTSRTRNDLTSQVFKDLVQAGADESIQWLTKAHIGTDLLQFYIRNMREMIQAAGGEIHFSSRLDEVDVRNGKLERICINGEWKVAHSLVLAIGHSARDTYEMLYQAGVQMESKDLAIGFRVEHPQEMINRRQYGKFADSPYLGAAEYVLNAPEKQGGAYSFCMCPGGVLVPCASAEGELATNGMSYSRRNTPFANSGLVVPVNLGSDPMAAIHNQRAIERKAFEIGGKNYGAPAQTLHSFVSGLEDQSLPKSSWPRDLVPFNHEDFFEPEVYAALKKSVLSFDRKIPGFIENGLLVSPETRTSSPVRIIRDRATLESSIQGIFAVGEGAGYSGGIISSAADGLRLACNARRQK